MGKAHRGKNIKTTPNWRGSCPICNRTGVKLLWEKSIESGSNLKVCKVCNNK